MNPDLPSSAVDFAASARRALAALGGVDAARRAEAEPRTRAQVAASLEALGIDDLDPRSDPEAAAAAAVLCEEAGRVVLPYPLAGALLRRDGLPFAVVGTGGARVDHGALFERWAVATLDAASTTARPTTTLLTRLGPFVTDLAPDQPPTAAVHAATTGARTAWWVTLTGWRILGALDHAVELAVAHTSGRIQFGKPLTAFQTVRFALADAAVAVAGLRELARFTLWRLHDAPAEALTDALALHCHALDVARTVLRATQQLHGASGLCDELDISILVRHLQPVLRLPEDADATAARLAAAVERSGFAGLFPHGQVH
jgi:hypothetical protein